MPTDIETQLRDLGERFRSEMIHVDPDEISDRPREVDPFENHPLVENVEPSTATHRGARWLTAVAAASILVLVVGLIMVSQRDNADVGVSNRPASCAAVDEPVSFDAQLFPAFDSDIAQTGYPSAHAAAGAYLADRTSAANLAGFPTDVSYDLVDGTRQVDQNTIVQANLYTDTAQGTVNIATRRIDTTAGGPRWVVQAATSNVLIPSTIEFTDGRVAIGVDPDTTGSNYATTNNPSSGEVIDAGGAQTAGGSPNVSTPPVVLDLVAGVSNPNLRYWFINADTIEFTEIQLNEGYPDYGEGWQALLQLQLC